MPERKKAEEKVAYFDTGPLPIYFGVCFSAAAFRSELSRLGIEGQVEFITPGANATVHTLEHAECQTTILLAFDPKSAEGRPPAQIAGLFAHEATHCTQRTLEAMREANPGAEVEAYLTGFFAQCAIAELERWRKARRRRKR